MQILLLGSNGQVGRAFQELSKTDLFPIGWTLLSWDRKEADLSEPDQLISTIERLNSVSQIGAIINTAAYTQVDLAEKETELCEKVNSESAAKLAAFCHRHRVPLVHFSTDYVYSGNGTVPHLETEECAPVNHYGRTKADGDQAIAESGCDHLIFRTSWVYSHEGKNFVLTMLRLGTEKKELRIVADQVGAPTYAPDLSKYALYALIRAMMKKVETGIFPSGVYHLTNSENTNWAEFAVTIFEKARDIGIDDHNLLIERIIPIASSEYIVPAKRPLNSRLNLQKYIEVFGVIPRSWKEALQECLQKIGTHHG